MSSSLEIESQKIKDLLERSIDESSEDRQRFAEFKEQTRTYETNSYASAVIESKPGASQTELYYFDVNCTLCLVTCESNFDMAPFIRVSYTNGVPTKVYSLSKDLQPSPGGRPPFYKYDEHGVLQPSPQYCC